MVNHNRLPRFTPIFVFLLALVLIISVNITRAATDLLFFVETVKGENDEIQPVKGNVTLSDSNPSARITIGEFPAAETKYFVNISVTANSTSPVVANLPTGKELGERHQFMIWPGDTFQGTLVARDYGYDYGVDFYLIFTLTNASGVAHVACEVLFLKGTRFIEYLFTLAFFIEFSALP